METILEIHAYSKANFWLLYPTLIAALALFHYRFPKGFPYLLGLMLLESALWAHHLVWAMMVPALLYAILPGLFLNALIYLIFAQRGERTAGNPGCRAKLAPVGGRPTWSDIGR